MSPTKQLNAGTLDSDVVLELDESELAQVAGGVKVAASDFHFVKSTDKSSPTLL
jgi:type VI protein secretion system component Hcp